MSNASSNASPTVLLDGLAYVESPRWHEGRLWLCDWVAQEVIVFDFRGAVPDTGASTVCRLGETPIAARDRLLVTLGEKPPSPPTPAVTMK